MAMASAVAKIASMPRCADCRYWIHSMGGKLAQQSYDWSPQNLGEDQGWCVATITGSHAGRDGCPENPKGESSLALTQDDEGYLACLVTEADFGCVQWEPATTPAPSGGGEMAGGQ